MKVHYVAPYLTNPPHSISVYLIGCGGTGSQVLSGLGRINHSLIALGHPGLFVYAFDEDVVSETNIGRQLFSPSDIGQNKATILVTRINRFFGTSWEGVPQNFCLQTLTESHHANIVITCVDQARVRVEVDKALKSVKNGRDENEAFYWMDFGNSHKTGQIILGTLKTIQQPESKFTVFNKLKNVVEEFPELETTVEIDEGPSCSIAQALGKQDLFINSTLAQLGCSLLWKLLTEVKIKERGLYLNLESFNVKSINL